MLTGTTTVGLGQEKQKVVTMVMLCIYSNKSHRKFICINDNIDHDKEGADVVSNIVIINDQL